MNISIIYSTNTGNTYISAQVIKDILSRDHSVTLTSAADATHDSIKNADLILLGSSSWDWQGKEGHPLKSMKDFLTSLESVDLTSRNFVIFGCGDKDFQLFCGAVTHIQDFVTQKGGKIIFEPLKIDKLYVDILNKLEQVKAWANNLNNQLQTL